MTTEEPCPQAWHGGLSAGLLRECKYPARHRGRHRTADGSLSWSGKLTDDELAQAAALRGGVSVTAARTPEERRETQAARTAT